MSTVRPIRPGNDEAILRPSKDDENPIDIIHDRLNQAAAIVDLIFTGHCHNDAFVEALSSGTLSSAMHSITYRISEALEAADRLHDLWRKAHRPSE